MADIPGEAGRTSGETVLRRKRVKVAILAIFFGIFSAAIELPLPAEDLLRAVRAQLRARPVPQDIVVIAVDDESLNQLEVERPTRFHESELLDRLAAAGVDRIVYDRAHADRESPESDAAFVEALDRHKGKVWLGASPSMTVGFHTTDKLYPNKAFRDRAPWAAMVGQGTPFGLSSLFPTAVMIEGRDVRSISSVLAGYEGPAQWYRPDYAFRPSSIPTLRYADVLAGRFEPGTLKGKRVVIGNTFFRSPDVYVMPFVGRVSGVYFHVMGAHTLRQGRPLDLKWYPALLVAALAIGAQALNRRRSSKALWAAAAGLPALTLVTDELGANFEVFPALLALAWAAIGFRMLSRKYYSATADAMTTSAFDLDRSQPERDVYALRIANLAEMSEDWSAGELGDFVNTLITYIKGPGDAGDVAFERDILVWLSPRMDSESLERHADGLALMLKTAISHDWQSANSAPALGIDTNHALPIGQRIKRAMQTADEAAARGVRFIINDAACLEARIHRYEILRVLEKGLRERNIGVAYQPKVELATGRIVGAESLIRWRPEGDDFVNPQELVLAAEASDQINELTLIVMETALTDAKQAIALDPSFKLAVNMSAKSISDTHLLFDIMTMLGRHAFPPENLTLELTETAKLQDQHIAAQISALRQRGIGLSIDDFGTGQSNLEYIEKLPSSELKIDKKFVQHMATSEESRAVVRATIEIAHSLGKVVVAEGVENHAVAATLRAMGCDQAQGYLFAQAIAMPELLAMMGGGQIAVNA